MYAQEAGADCVSQDVFRQFNEKFNLLEKEKESLRSELVACGANKGPQVTPKPIAQTQKDGRNLRYLEKKIEDLKSEKKVLKDRISSLGGDAEAEGSADGSYLDEFTPLVLDEKPLEIQENKEDSAAMADAQDPAAESGTVEKDQPDRLPEEDVVQEDVLLTKPDDVAAVSSLVEQHSLPDLDIVAAEDASKDEISTVVIDPPPSVQTLDHEERGVLPDCEAVSAERHYESSKGIILQNIQTQYRDTVGVLLDDLWRLTQVYQSLTLPDYKGCDDIESNLAYRLVIEKLNAQERSSVNVIQFLYNEKQNFEALNQTLRYQMR